jgi:anti-sigma-K factor RskA
MSIDHEGLRDLVAVYALDALDDDEAARVEDHLRDCPRCREELRGHQETAALLAHEGSDAPEGLWDRIAAGVAPEPDVDRPRLELIVGERSPSAPSRSRSWGWRAAAAAAVVVVAAGTGVEVAHQNHRINQLSSALAGQSLLQQATSAALDPSAHRLALTSANGTVQATAAVLPNGVGYVVDTAMPGLSGDKTYQLWSLTSGRSISAGLMGPHPTVTRFHLAPGASAVAVTVEPEGGSAEPTGQLVATGQV